MTEFWVSRSKHWCEYCKVWIDDSKNARARHEDGEKHKAAVAQRLRDMHKQAEDEKRVKEMAERDMGRINAEAYRQFEKDRAEQGLLEKVSEGALTPWERHRRRAAEEADRKKKLQAYLEKAREEELYRRQAASRPPTDATSNHAWTYDPDTNYHYNADGYYYDRASRQYYNSTTGQWSENAPPPPPLPPDWAPSSLPVDLMEPKEEPAPAVVPTQPSAVSRTAAAPVSRGRPLGVSRGSVAKLKGVVSGKTTALTPAQARPAASRSKPALDVSKLSEEDRKALAAREAAKAKVVARTIGAYGYNNRHTAR